MSYGRLRCGDVRFDDGGEPRKRACGLCEPLVLKDLSFVDLERRVRCWKFFDFVTMRFTKSATRTRLRLIVPRVEVEVAAE